MRLERCPTCRRRMTRSSDANRRLWALYHVMADRIKPSGRSYSADQWHLYCKTRFLGCDDIVLPNRKVFAQPRSTSTLDVADFSAYMTQVEAFANENGAWLEDAEFAA